MSESTAHTRPRPSLRVGVTGHRMNKLDGGEATRLRRYARDVLAGMRAAAEAALRKAWERWPNGSALQVISPLAEGADRLVARAAIEEGATLIAPLPFPRDAYVQDFDDAASRADFFALLQQASEIIELDGRRGGDAERAAYAAVGAWVANECDILIAVWDGRKASGAGGTAEVVQRARRLGRPVLWLPTGMTNATNEAASPRLLLDDTVVTADVHDAVAKLAASLVLRKL
jgi:hypothetical protein